MAGVKKGLSRIGIHFTKREKLPWYLKVINPVVCVALALLFCGIIIRLEGHDPFQVYTKMFKNAFGTSFSILESALQGIPLIFCSLGVSAALKMSVSNVGAEGQFCIGAFAATGIALFCPWIPDSLMIPAMLLGGFAAGGLWAVITILPRVFLNVNETIITLMSNYIALLFIEYWCYGPWRDRGGNNYPYSPLIPASARLSTLGNSRLHTGLFIGIAVAILLFLFFRYTTSGYKMRVIGDNRNAARYAGINVKKSILLAMLISGGIAGLAGVVQVGGQSWRLMPNISNGSGYTAIIIAWLSKLNPFVIVLVSVLFGGLIQGGLSLQIMGIPSNIVTMIQGVILLFVLGGEIFSRNRLVIVKKS